MRTRRHCSPGASDFDARGGGGGACHGAIREGDEVADECVGVVPRHVDPVVRDGEERRFRAGRFGMPVKLHVHPAGPLYNRVAADRVRERGDDYSRSIVARRLNSSVDVSDEIAGPLAAERIGNRGLEPEDGQVADGRLNRSNRVQLGVGVTVTTACLAALPPNVATKLGTKRSKSAGGT